MTSASIWGVHSAASFFSLQGQAAGERRAVQLDGGQWVGEGPGRAAEAAARGQEAVPRRQQRPASGCGAVATAVRRSAAALRDMD